MTTLTRCPICGEPRPDNGGREPICTICAHRTTTSERARRRPGSLGLMDAA